MSKHLTLCLLTAIAVGVAIADDFGFDDFPPGPSPDGEMAKGEDGRPPEPPEWDGNSNGRRRGPPPGNNGMIGRRGGRGPGGMRGDDPSDPSQYSGMVEVTDKKALENVSLVSDKSKTSPLYVKSGGELSVKGGRLTSSAEGANAVLVIGKGAKAVVEDVDIETSADSSRGLYAFQGGEIRARNVRIATKGAHCAAMATDRGEGTVSVEGGTLDTAGDGSPCIYSTGDLSAKDVKGTATGSEAMVIEGRNSIALENADLAGYLKCGAMLYQSFSGDAREGVAKLKMASSRLTAKTGPLFFVTNTRAEIELRGSELVTASDNQPLLKVAPARWGRTGQNGGSVTLTAEDQKLDGDVEVSSISSATLDLRDGAVLTGALDAKGEAKELVVRLAKGARLVLTGDSRVTALENADPTGANIVRNGHRLAIGEKNR